MKTQEVKKQVEVKPVIHLCDRHLASADWSDCEVIRTGRQSCDICKEK